MGNFLAGLIGAFAAIGVAGMVLVSAGASLVTNAFMVTTPAVRAVGLVQDEVLATCAPQCVPEEFQYVAVRRIDGSIEARVEYNFDPSRHALAFQFPPLFTVRNYPMHVSLPDGSLRILRNTGEQHQASRVWFEVPQRVPLTQAIFWPWR